MNKDVLSEIADHLLYYDLKNLKLALPELNLTEELYTTNKNKTLRWLSTMIGDAIFFSLANVYHSEHRSSIFKHIVISDDITCFDIDEQFFTDLVKLSGVDASGFFHENFHYMFNNALNMPVEIRNKRCLLPIINRYAATNETIKLASIIFRSERLKSLSIDPSSGRFNYFGIAISLIILLLIKIKLI